MSLERRYWWDDLSDEELRARLAQRANSPTFPVAIGTAEALVDPLVADREDEQARRIIAAVLGD